MLVVFLPWLLRAWEDKPMCDIRSQTEDCSQWDLTFKDLKDFYSMLNHERRSMNLNLEQMGSAEIIVAQRQRREIAGIAGVRRVRHLPVAFFVVRQPFQGQGIGRQLVRKLHNTLRSAGYRMVFLSVLRSNARAIQLYKNQRYTTFFANSETLYMVRPLWSAKQ